MQTFHWNSKLYDAMHDYVSGYGESLIHELQPAAGERIVDLGCGTGDLAAQIAEAGATVIGLDASPQMISAAQEKYPHLEFQVADAHQFTLNHQANAVFSNAALHWMTQPEKAALCVFQCLQPGGRFVGEFGGAGNIQLIQQAIHDAIRQLHPELQPEAWNPWYFPTIGEYSRVLESAGFRVEYAAHYSRPTPLQDGEQGLENWLKQFASMYFDRFRLEEQNELYQSILTHCRPKLYDQGRWQADYMRLRFRAVKPSSC